MKILVLESSGNIRGSSNMLAEKFIQGAEENGHEITRYNVIHKNIKPCLGCGKCGMSGACVLQDDYTNELKPLILNTDMIVFVMPVYYYNWPAQLKMVVDRFYSFTVALTAMHKKAALLAVAWDSTNTVFTVTEAYYKQICDYMQFEDCGTVLGRGCGSPSMTRETKYPRLAYELGRSLS